MSDNLDKKLSSQISPEASHTVNSIFDDICDDPVGLTTSSLINAFGITKTIKEWSRDPKCGCSMFILLQRIKDGSNPDAAILTREVVPAVPLKIRNLTAFHETKTVAAWASDRRCRCTRAELQRRTNIAWTEELSLQLPDFKKPNPRTPIYQVRLGEILKAAGMPFDSNAIEDLAEQLRLDAMATADQKASKKRVTKENKFEIWPIYKIPSLGWSQLGRML